MPDPLTIEQINSAMAKIHSHWPGQSMPDSVKDTWRRKLACLFQGEFLPALDAWLDGPNARYRPDIGAFMETVGALRRSAPKVWQPPPDDDRDPEAANRFFDEMRSKGVMKVGAS